MTFGTLTARRSSDQTGNSESPFLRLEEGKDVIVRILDQSPVEFWSYWLDVNVGGTRQGRSVIVGKDNPVKKYMDTLGDQHPKYRKVSHRARINVLNRTPDASTSGEPMNKVQILEYGPALETEFNTLHQRARKRTDFNIKLSIWEFDLLLITTFKIPGDNKSKSVKPMQHLDDNPLDIAYLSLPRYDLKAVSQPMPNAALQALIDGADYGEVMKSLGRETTYPTYTP